jgi:hypothetical protein
MLVDHCIDGCSYVRVGQVHPNSNIILFFIKIDPGTLSGHKGPGCILFSPDQTDVVSVRHVVGKIETGTFQFCAFERKAQRYERRSPEIPIEILIRRGLRDAGRRYVINDLILRSRKTDISGNEFEGENVK